MTFAFARLPTGDRPIRGRVFFVSTSKLQRQVNNLLSTHLGGYTIRENYRPEWLSTQHGRLELDFYIEGLETTIEVQGRQHYVYTPLFHGNEDGFTAQLERDAAKQQVCQQRGIKLIEIDTYDEALEVVLLLAGRKYEYPVHQNAIEQGKREYIIAGEADKVFAEYPYTIRKHLRRIHKILLKASKQRITEKNRDKLDISLRAIKQYEEATGIIWTPQKDALELIAFARNFLDTSANQNPD